MIDLKLVQKQPEVLAKALADRQSPLKVDEFLELDGRRRALLAEVESLKQQQNAASRQVAQIKREGGDASHMMEELGALSARIKALDVQTAEAKAAVENWLMGVPNIPDASVPVGKDETENVEVLRWGTPRQFDFDIRQHWELGGAALDFERATRLAGSRFALYMGWAARLDRALVNFFLDQHVKHEDYIEVCPPFMVNRATMTGTGQLPKFEEDLFKMPAWDYYLIPTAEVPLTNIHAGEVLDEADLPRAYCAATPCFRSEAGAAGKDTRGLIRLHQFTKVEMVRFAHPDDSFNQLEIMVGHARTPAGKAGAALPRHHPVHGRHGLRFRQDLRPGSLAACPEHLPRDLLLLQLHRFPGPPCGHPLQAQGRQEHLLPHPQRFRPAHRPRHGRHPGERPAEGRQHRAAQGPGALHGRRGSHRACGQEVVHSRTANLTRRCPCAGCRLFSCPCCGKRRARWGSGHPCPVEGRDAAGEAVGIFAVPVVGQAVRREPYVAGSGARRLF